MKEGHSTDNERKHYKFKSLKVYSSTEWLADNKKKYRQVFDKNLTSYIYVELAFVNKKFDEGPWEANMELKCFELKKNKKELCSLKFKKKISKYDNIVYLREGWGHKKNGNFWKRGTYYWEAWIDGAKVATKYFYVEDAPNVNEDNPYVKLNKVQLYEGQYDDVNENERQYLEVFSTEETRYVYTEMSFENIYTRADWHMELFVKFYNEAKELKGQVTRLQTVKKGDNIINVTAGWGSNVKGSWKEGNYTIEIVFMDKCLATVMLSVEEEAEEGAAFVLLPNRHELLNEPEESDNDKTFEEVFSDLEQLVGLDEIKSRVREHAQYIQFLQLRKEKGFEEKQQINIHSVFTGNPGTGKTTVAKMMGLLYRKMGLLKKGHVHEVDRVDLVGEYIGQTAPKVKAAIEKARGGVLFIDEAYALARANDDSKDFGKEVIEILVKEMSSGARDFAVIVAGYPKEMKYFIDSNPGLKSRFRHFFDFRDYVPQELIQIADYATNEKELVFKPSAQVLLNEIITNAYRKRDRSFGNARYVHELVEKAKFALGLRIMSRKNPTKATKDEMKLVLKKDIQTINVKKKSVTPSIPIDYKLLDDSMKELNSLIGIANIKKEISDLVNVVQYYREADKDVLRRFFLHTVFVGNPGTGKTTVARILTKIYKALGILERGHMIETDRQGLIAGFVGQTAIKTTERIDEAIGGVLFIDEAYALTSISSQRGDFGNEAIQTILKRMEDDRGEFFVFAAGYPENMERFLKANPGLSSRFDKILRFDDYGAEDLVSIALEMLKKEKYKIFAEAKKVLKSKFTNMHNAKDKFFGNARTVRRVILEIIQQQNLRLSLQKGGVDPKLVNVIVVEDVEAVQFDLDQKAFDRKGIGFNH